MKQAQSEKAELRAQIAALKEEQARDSIKMAELEKEYFDDVQKGFDLLKERTGSNWSEECRITIEDLAPWPALCTLMYQVKANRSQ